MISLLGNYPDKLHQVMTPIMDHATCVNVMKPYNVDDSMICAGFPDGEKGACSVSKHAKHNTLLKHKDKQNTNQF